VLEGIRQSEGEDDEAFLLRAERVTEMENDQIRERARLLLAAAVNRFDKADAAPGAHDKLDQMMKGASSTYVAVRACLLARSLCREMQATSTGPDPVAENAYQLLSRLVLEALRDHRS
jgi:hypothetical protein